MEPGPPSVFREFLEVLEVLKGEGLIESFKMLSGGKACVVIKMPLTFISVRMDVLDEGEKEGN